MVHIVSLQSVLYVLNVNVSSRTSLFFCFSSSGKLNWLCPRGFFWRCFHLIFSVKRFWPEVTDHIRAVFRLTDHLIKLKSIAAAPLALRFCSPLSKVKSLFSKHTSWSLFTLLFSSIDQWITLTQTLENSRNRSLYLFHPLGFERAGWKMFLFIRRLMYQISRNCVFYFSIYFEWGLLRCRSVHS